MVDLKHLERVCESALEVVGYDLIDVEYSRQPQGWVLRVFIDHPFTEPADRSVAPQRITHRDCAVASRHLGTALDVEDLISGPYSLEVSSPGVLRPLRKVRDFRRFMGFEIKVKSRSPIEGQRNLVGSIASIDDERLTLSSTSGSVTLPLSNIHYARLNEEY